MKSRTQEKRNNDSCNVCRERLRESKANNMNISICTKKVNSKYNMMSTTIAITVDQWPGQMSIYPVTMCMFRKCAEREDGWIYGHQHGQCQLKWKWKWNRTLTV